MNRARVLVDTAWVDQHRDDIVLIDVDEDTTAYDVGHIDSALKLDWTRDLQDQVCRDLIDAPGFERLMSRLGVANDTTVVLYGGNNNWFAAYAYWLFKLYGHDNVRLLDGGRKRWEAEGRPLTTAVPASRTRTRYVAKPNPALRAMREEVLESAGTHNLVDVRTPDEYAGRLLAPAHLPHEQAQRAGHIPGAINVPWSRAVRDDGRNRLGEKDPGNTFICGMTGTGKSVLLGFLLTLLTKVLGLRILFFDKDRGAEILIRALGGRYRQLQRGQPTGFNP
ncbi:MAG TPA: rhodanese-like domain-containing protein, partial [Marmoricola sp.]|nr:rhodanese-like domain-containing protein [Marmoricola sp.]